MFAVFTFKIEVLIVLKLTQKNHVSVKSKLESALSPLAKKQHHVTSNPTIKDYTSFSLYADSHSRAQESYIKIVKRVIWPLS